MPTSKTSLDFKLIAVRVLPGCGKLQIEQSELW